MGHDQVRVDRGAIQSHVDDTKANMGSFRSSNDAVDRQQAHLINQTEGGVGSEEFGRTRAGSNRHGEDINSNVDKLNSRTSENTDQFVSNVRSAAAKSIRPI